LFIVAPLVGGAAAAILHRVLNSRVIEVIEVTTLEDQ
jgi:hypothetical protein